MSVCASLRFAREAICTGLRGGVAALLSGCLMPAAHAWDDRDGSMQVHGFLSQGIVFTSDNRLFGSSEDGSLDFREAGVNVSWRLHADWQLAGQLLSHRAGESDDGDARVDYALVDWTALSGEWGRAGVRLGRVKNPYGLYNKTRDVAFTRPSILLPQSIYFERTRNLAMASDGAELYLERHAPSGSLYLNLAAGWPDAGDRATEAALLGRQRPGRFNSEFTRLLQAMYEGEGGRYRVGITAAWVNVAYRRRGDALLSSGQIDFDPVIVSGQYNAETWSLTGEYALRKTRRRDFGALADIEFTGESYYLQATCRVRPKAELLLRYDVLYSDRDDRHGHAFARASGLPAHTRYARDWTMGLRYDVTPQFMLRAEYHRVDGTGWLPGLDNPDPMALERRWDVIMLLGSFRF